MFHWIHGESKRHPAFIANRVGEILDTTEPSQWNHCPGALNPADDGSRGLPVTAITSESRWLNGPVFLSLSEEKWPKGNSKLESSSQKKQETSAYSASQAQTSKEEFISLAKYSSLTRLLRVTAYSFRFVYNCRCRRPDHQSGPLLVEELEHARKFWIGTAKVKSFPQEIATLKRNQQVSPTSRLASLSPFLDGDEIVRVGGRIERADIPFSSRHPIVLSPDNELSRLIVMDCHEKLRHEGVQHVRNELRRQYWIPRCRTAVRKILHRSSYRRRRRVKPEPPLMAGLPANPLQVAPAFSKVGGDFFGPLKVKHLRKQEKIYGCLFTCLVTRRVHLEVAHSLSTDSFIMSL